MRYPLWRTGVDLSTGVRPKLRLGPWTSRAPSSTLAVVLTDSAARADGETGSSKSVTLPGRCNQGTVGPGDVGERTEGPAARSAL